MPDFFQLEMVVAAEPQRVFSTWMDSREHAAFTGGGDAVVEAWAGGRFIAWDGYIHGILLGVDEGRRIVQTWRTAEFAPESRDSRVVVEFEPARGGTRVVVRHSDLPPSHLKRYEKGWMEHYLKPLARYFAKGAKQRTPSPPAPPNAWGRQPEPTGRRTPAKAAAAQKPARKEQKAAARKPARKPAPRPRPSPRKAAPASRKAAPRKAPARKAAPRRSRR